MAKPPTPPPGISLPPEPRPGLSGNARWVVVLAMAIEVPGRARGEDGEGEALKWGSGLLGRCKELPGGH